MKCERYNKQLVDFIKNSPTPFHVVENMKNSLNSAGFQSLNEQNSWNLKNGCGYYVTRNDSSIIAFILGSKDSTETGIRLIGAHTDSPCLKIKPEPEVVKNSYYQLGVEVYGGVLLNTWFDRDLSIAGKVNFKARHDGIKETLINIKKPIASIPSLAIHLNRNANNNHSINPQTDMLPILYGCDDTKNDFREIIAQEIIMHLSPTLNLSELSVMDYDLSLYDNQPPAIIGLKDEFLSSARLDNILSCFAGLQAILSSNKDVTSFLACYDHEEVGSTSNIGANSSFMESLLNRIYVEPELRSRVIAKSMLISTDNAHGVHPNFSNKHDKNHAPVINQGLVIKINANQRYATSSLTSSIIKDLCKQLDIPTQTFVNRADMTCGSTIGPITAANIGIRAIDIGVPTFAMHSIREVAGVKDGHYLYKMLKAFIHTKRLL